jgi:hypothetical protein
MDVLRFVGQFEFRDRPILVDLSNLDQSLV